jgi:predicted dehydrogenase
MALHLMGEPAVQSVSASTYAEFGPRGRGGANWGISTKTGGDGTPHFEVEDLATAFIRTVGAEGDSGTLLLESSWAQGIGHDDMYVTLFGTEGGAELTWNRPGAELRVWTQIDGMDATLHPPIGINGGHAEAIADFVAAVRSGDTSRQGAEALTRSLILDAAYQSATDAAEVRLEPVPVQPVAAD